MMKYAFNWRKPFGKHSVDFLVGLLNLIIEPDGDYHEEEHKRSKTMNGNKCWKK